MAEWLPIESAPRDGTPILAYRSMISYPQRWPTFYAVIAWRAATKKGDYNWYIFDANYKNYGSGPTWSWSDPTHWQPLPPPPSP